MSSILVPVFFVVVWAIFVVTNNMVTKLVSLLLTSLLLPLMYMESFKLYWPCSLLLILMSTGLIVVFAYIVSLHSNVNNYNPLSIYFFMMMVASLLYFASLSKGFSSYKITHFYWKVDVSPLLSLFLILLLLMLVISFIRMAYSKGGGFRKKF